MFHANSALPQPFSNLFNGQPHLVCLRTVCEPIGYLLACWLCLHTVVKDHLRINNIMLLILIGSRGILRCDHNLMQLFPFPNANLRHCASRQHCLCQSVILNEGILLIKVSPPLASFNAFSTSSTPSGRLIQNLVIL